MRTKCLEVSTVRGRRSVKGMGSVAPEAALGEARVVAHTGYKAVCASGPERVGARWIVYFWARWASLSVVSESLGETRHMQRDEKPREGQQSELIVTNGVSLLHTIEIILVFYKLNSAMERGTKPDA